MMAAAASAYFGLGLWIPARARVTIGWPVWPTSFEGVPGDATAGEDADAAVEGSSMLCAVDVDDVAAVPGSQRCAMQTHGACVCRVRRELGDEAGR